MTSLTDSPQKPRGKEKSKALRETVDAHIEQLASAVDAVRASEEFVAYLDTAARFHRYSWCNTLLIASQCPQATQVAGFRAWLKLDRRVRKGQKGIAIFAPMPWSREEKNGKGETETVSGCNFRVVHVFDVLQTSGKPLPTVDCPDIEEAADSLLASLRQVAVGRGITLLFGPSAADGAYGASMKGSINVNDSYTTGQQAKTLAHELAHEALHWEDRGELTRSIAELEAESVAYVVCRHFGLDSSVRSSKYIAIWSGDGKSLRASLERIAKTARAIIDETEALEDHRRIARAVA